LIINPVAGMGGRVGLKGSDGALAGKAKSMGAIPIAETRARIAMTQFAAACPDVEVLTAPGSMGAAAAERAGLETRVVSTVSKPETSAADTQTAARAIIAEGAALLLFVGGDGTARDIYSVVDRELPVLGVPSGVKMHSALFAASARAAGEVAARYLCAADRTGLLADAEILDRVEVSTPGRSPELFGVVRTPRSGFLVPAAKNSRPGAEPLALAAAVNRVATMLSDDRLTLIGPGSTMQSLMAQLRSEGSLLGIDATRNGKLIAKDLNESDILDLIAGKPARIVLSVVGGQGFLFGRGNQQLSPTVLSQVGAENIVIVSSLEKLAGLPGNCLLIDTGDEDVDAALAGYLPVIVSEARIVMMPVKSVATEIEADRSVEQSAT
jgi:predicted polyphosphate/ATP-dependent NAD kinase